jgi:hypothetical protein
VIGEQRIYTIAAGRLPEFLAIYEERGLAIQCRFLGRLIGCFTTEVGELSTIVYLWGYHDMEDRGRRRTALAGETAWQEYLAACTPLIQKMENRILMPTSFSPLS